MNILNSGAGYVTVNHILNSGFVTFSNIRGNDMGQMSYNLPQFTNGKINILGGYYNYVIRSVGAQEKLFEGWWNSNEEFDNTMKEINLKKLVE